MRLQVTHFFFKSLISDIVIDTNVIFYNEYQYLKEQYAIIHWLGVK